MTDAENWTPDERTVRACIEALPKPIAGNQVSYDLGYAIALSKAKESLESLLPRDPVKEIFQQIVGETEAMDRTFYEGFKEAIRRLIDTGRVK